MNEQLKTESALESVVATKAAATTLGSPQRSTAVTDTPKHGFEVLAHFGPRHLPVRRKPGY